MDEELMKELLEAIKEDIKETKETLKDMQVDVSHIKEDLKVHIYRTDLLEQDLKYQREETDTGFEQVHNEIKPIQTHVNMVKGAAALIGIALTVLSILALLKII